VNTTQRTLYVQDIEVKEAMMRSELIKRLWRRALVATSDEISYRVDFTSGNLPEAKNLMRHLAPLAALNPELVEEYVNAKLEDKARSYWHCSFQIDRHDLNQRIHDLIADAAGKGILPPEVDFFLLDGESL